jgi:arylsulfatase A-like enzyme
MRPIVLIIAAILASTAVQAQVTMKPKNVLILYSDDHSYHALGVMGNKEVQTPNLDKLAASGMLFRQTHVMGGHQGAVCIPSRVMLLTGRLVNRLPGDGGTIPDSLVGLPEVLRSRGYTTYHTGKWHSDKASHSRFFSTGGDVFFGGMHFEKDGGQPHPTVYRFDSSGSYPASRKRVADTFSSTLYANNAIRFLNSDVAQEKPFFCYVAFTSPHDPRTPPAAFAQRYNPADITLPPNFAPQHPFDNGDMNVRDEQLFPRPLTKPMMQQDIANYYAMISEMDHQVGKILDALERNGLRDNTIIVFAGDNGLAVGQHGLLGKQNLYEHSIRVPMIMAGPGIPKGSAYSGFNYLSDIAPTLYEYLGVRQPATVEGKSHFSVFKKPKELVRHAIYNVYGHWSRSYKSADGFKLILYNVDGVQHTQLFNLTKDPWEMQDLSTQAAYQQKVAELTSQLSKEMAASHDNLNIALPNWGRQSIQKGRGS